MQQTNYSKLVVLCILTLLFLAAGCQSKQPAVVAVTGTNLGLELSQSPATQAPQMKLGYNRGEVAIVSKEKFKDNDTANVVMELRYGGNTVSTHPGIYQRLAVGNTAVAGAGAAVMFSRDASGKLSPESLQKAKEALEAIGEESKDGN